MYRTVSQAAHATRISDRVYGEIKRLLLDGELPYNDFLGEERLAARLGCSRTPVREALLHLEAEGFLGRDAAGHFRPRPPEMGGMRELYAVRAALERLSVLSANDKSAITSLHEEWRGLEAAAADRDFVYLDECLHVGIAESGGNRALVEMLRQVNERIRVVRIQAFLISGSIEATIAQHLAILQSLLDDEREAAARQMESHITESAANVEVAVGRLLARGLEGAGE